MEAPPLPLPTPSASSALLSVSHSCVLLPPPPLSFFFLLFSLCTITVLTTIHSFRDRSYSKCHPIALSHSFTDTERFHYLHLHQSRKHCLVPSIYTQTPVPYIKKKKHHHRTHQPKCVSQVSSPSSPLALPWLPPLATTSKPPLSPKPPPAP